MTMGRVALRGLSFAWLLIGSTCLAQEVPPTQPQGSLVDAVNSGAFAFNALDRVSAYADQASYNALTQNPNGPVFCDPFQTGPSPSCPLATFQVFSNLRSLVQTANQLLQNDQDTRYSMNYTSYQQLENAFRSTAPEELSAPGSVATSFANGQIASIAQRVEALRFGASGFSVNGLSMNTGDALLAWAGSTARGGGASADDIGIASRWSGYFNSSYGWGERAPTVLEDAFSYDSRDATLGVDYRVSRALVLGLMMGYSGQRINFDASQSVTGGSIRSIGWSLQAYGLYEFDAGPYVNISVGGQRTTYHTTRLINIPSFSPDVPSIDATAFGVTRSTAFLSNMNAGWPLSMRAFTAEPYLGVQYQNIGIAGFGETSINNETNAFVTAGSPAGLDLSYAGQRINDFEGALGLRLQYAFRPPFGVIVPFVKGEYKHRFDRGVTQLSATYNATPDAIVGFDLSSDRPGINFFQYAGGASVVLKHGIQAFLQYQGTANLAYTSTHLISAGIRGEF